MEPESQPGSSASDESLKVTQSGQSFDPDATIAIPAPSHVDADASTATETWRHLQLNGRVGAGAFGEVYRAWDPDLQREVALKLLLPEAAQTDELLREGRLIARLRHPNIVTVYGVAHHEGRVGLWEEFISGRTLAQLVKQNGRFSAEEAIAAGTPICQALAAVHNAGLLHRDIKAENVMREAGGRIVLMDFGVGLDSSGKAGPASPFAGTPVYMAPEVLNGGPASRQSDIYAVGVLLFYLVTGSFPVDAPSLKELKEAHKSGHRSLLEDLRPDLPRTFVDTVERAISSDPAYRFETVGQLFRSLSDQKPAPRRSRSVWTYAALAVLILAAVGAASYRFLFDRATDASIAVLPFLNLSPESENEYLADGLAEEIIAQLSKIENLRVVARSSTNQFRGRNQDPLQAGQRLGVRSVLTGSVRRAADRIRVSAELVNVRDGTQVWASTYEREIKDAFAVQDQISRAVADALRARFTRTASTKQAGTAEAYDLYLRGRFQANRGGPANLKQAIAYFQQAIEQNPNYARAYAGLAHAYANLTVVAAADPDLARKATEMANRALSLDNGLAEAHTAIGFIKQSYEWDWAGAEKEFQQAIDVNPRDAEARFSYAGFLMNLLRTNEARIQLASAERLDPISPRVPQFMSLLLLIERRNNEAEQEVRKLLAAAPDIVNGHTLYGLILMRQGRKAEALPSLRRAAEIAKSPYVTARLAWALGQAGQTAEAQRLLAVLRAAHSRGEASPVALAAAYAGLNQLNPAFAAMDEAVKNHDPALVQILIAPIFDQLKSDARFDALLQRMNLKNRKS